MVVEECEENDRRRPRARQQSEGSAGEDLVDEDEDMIDDEDSDEDSDDEELEIPDDPAHVERMRALRAENARLMAVVEAQDQCLAEMSERTRQIQEATAKRREEINQRRIVVEEQKKNARERMAKGDHERDDKDQNPDGASSASQPLK